MALFFQRQTILDSKNDHCSCSLVRKPKSRVKNGFLLYLRSLPVPPGKPVVFSPASDLRITNVALGHELADKSGRTTLQLTYPTPVKVDDDDSDDDAPNDIPPMSTTVLCSLTPGKVCKFS